GALGLRRALLGLLGPLLLLVAAVSDGLQFLASAAKLMFGLLGALLLCVAVGDELLALAAQSVALGCELVAGALGGVECGNGLVAGLLRVGELLAQSVRFGLGTVALTLRGGDSLIGLQLYPLPLPLRRTDLCCD